MLALIKKNDCPKAAHTQAKNENLLNPFIAPGDPVQVKITTEKSTQISSKSVLPSGWKLVGNNELAAGNNVITLMVPNSVKAGSHKVRLITEDKMKSEFTVTVVDQVGKH